MDVTWIPTGDKLADARNTQMQKRIHHWPTWRWQLHWWLQGTRDALSQNRTEEKVGEYD